MIHVIIAKSIITAEVDAGTGVSKMVILME